MGVSGDSPSQKGSWRFFTRKKQVDSASKNTKPLLAQELTIPHLIAIGVGSTIGAGVYVLVGTVAREHSGPALAISFLIAGLAAGLSAFCYAELACRCPSAGSAYHYSYICLGEGVAWLIGWSLILEYTIGAATVARGVTPNLAPIFGGLDNLPFFLSRQHIPGIDITVDPCAAVLVMLVTGLLCLGIKESTVVQGIVTSVNVCALLFVVIAGGYLGFKSGWAGYELPTGYFPFGVDGMLAGSATVFFAYVGFDAVASTAEEVRNPQRDLPLGIGASLFLCCGIYMLVSIVVVGLVPYYAINPDTPISSAFAVHGMQWAGYIINAGACTALISALMGGILPQVSHLMKTLGTLSGYLFECNYMPLSDSEHDNCLMTPDSVLEPAGLNQTSSGSGGYGGMDCRTTLACTATTEIIRKKRSGCSAFQTSERTLDAPDLVDDYYLNLLDWGSASVLAIALGNTVYLWDASNGSTSELMTVEDEDGPVTSVSWAPDGRHIAVGLNNSEVQLWDTASDKQLRTLRGGHRQRVGSLAWNNHILTTGGMDGRILNNDVRVRSPIVDTYRGHEQEVCGLKWSASGQQLASGGNDNLLYIWDRGTASSASPTQWLHRLEDHTSAVKALAWCPFQGNLLATGGGSGDRSIKFWNTHTGACLNSVDTGSQVCSLLWNKNERELLSSHGFTQNQLTLWKYPSMVKMAELNGHTSRVLYMAQSPDGCTVATAAADETLRFWNAFGTPEVVAKAAPKAREPFSHLNRIR